MTCKNECNIKENNTKLDDSQKHIGIENCCEESVLLNNTVNNIKCNYKGADASKKCNPQQIMTKC